MDEDFFLTAGANRWQALEAQKAQTLADLQAARANFDYDSAGEAVERLGVIAQRQAAISALHAQHAQSLNPPAPEPLSPEMEQAKPLSQMTYADAYKLAATSRHGVDDAAFQAGIQEVQRRRARGE